MTAGKCLVLLILLADAGYLQAAVEDGNCWGLSLPKVGQARLMQVGSAQTRLHFVKNQSDADVCPAVTPACQRRAYLVPGDEVIAVGESGDFVCAGFVGKTGQITSGWLPSAALQAKPELPHASAEWAGDWRREEGFLQIEALGAERIAVSGQATWGGHDPERVAIGAVNVGEIERTELSLNGAVLHLESGVGAVDPKQQQAYNCVLSLQRIGRALLVRDSGRCGGMNVSFDGVYLRP